MKCYYLPPNVHGGGNAIIHGWDDKDGVWGSGIKMGQSCECGEVTWTEADAVKRDEAIDRMTNDPNLNRM